MIIINMIIMILLLLPRIQISYAGENPCVLGRQSDVDDEVISCATNDGSGIRGKTMIILMITHIP